MQSFPFFDKAQIFYPVLDGERHQAKIWWNIAGERWFILLTDSMQNLVLNAPVIESTRAIQHDIIKGYFPNNTLIYNVNSQAFEIDAPVEIPPELTSQAQTITIWDEGNTTWDNNLTTWF